MVIVSPAPSDLHVPVACVSRQVHERFAVHAPGRSVHAYDVVLVGPPSVGGG
jgi:hypothetical protein